MIIENEFGVVDFDLDFEKFKRIGVSFSGGADSTLLFWLLMSVVEKEMPDVEITPLTGVTPQKGKFKQFTSGATIDRLRDDFPNATRLRRPRRIIYNRTQDELAEWHEKLLDDGEFDVILYGLTRNPPIDVMKQHNLIEERIERRDFETGDKEIWKQLGGSSENIYEPFANIDKRWIGQCYRDFDLMLYYMNTISCERLRDTPDMTHSEEPCKHCWWCREKKMAFGMYDGGVV